MNILLIGYRGTGKTSVARHLALRLSWTWLDADVAVEMAVGKPIARIFEEDGESYFRDIESEILVRHLRDDKHIFALGGGIVVRPENREHIKTVDNVVWLRATAKTIHQRLAADPTTITRRPNLTADGGLSEIIQVLSEREDLYRQCTGVQVDTDNKDVADVAEEIVGRLNLKSSAS